jgi:adenylate cyclase
MSSRSRSMPLPVKVNLIIIMTLIAGIGIITFNLATRLFTTIEESSRESLRREANAIYAAIQEIMLPGRADLVQDFIDRMNVLNPDSEVVIYRTNGVEAFHDSITVNEVNNFRQEVIFDHSPIPGNPKIIEGTEQESNFNDAINLVLQNEVFFEVNEEDTNFIGIFKPLINLPECTACHGDETLYRGVIDIRANQTESQSLQQNAIILSSALFLTMVILIAVILAFFLTRTVLKPVSIIREVCVGVTQGDFNQRVDLSSNDELGVLGNTVNTMVEGLVERFKLSKYVSGSTIQNLSDDELGSRENLVLLFTDIRGFTSYSESNPAEEVVKNLNLVLNLQTEIIIDHHGDVDKYVGDEIMAVFRGDNASVNAALASIEIQQKMISEKASFANLEVGIGLNKGEAISGRIGSEQRADYTVIGDNVNVAARLCNSAKGGEVLISESIYSDLKSKDFTKESFQGPYKLSVKGKSLSLRVYRLIWN